MKRFISSMFARPSAYAAALLVLSSCTSGDSANHDGRVESSNDNLAGSNAQVHGATTATRNWRADLLGKVEGPPVGTNGAVYIGNDLGYLTAIDPRTGLWLWDVFVRGVIRSAPTVGLDGTVYVATDASGLHAVDPVTHLEKWAFDVGSAITSPVIGDDGTIYVGNQAGAFFAVNPTGTQKWKFTAGGAIESSAAVGPDGTVYFGSNDKSVYALTPQGAQKWKRAVANKVRSTPVVGNGNVYVGSDANKLHALDAITGAIRWERDASLSTVRSSPAIAPNGNVFIGTSTSKVLAFTPTGTAVWTYSTGSAVSSSPIIDVDARLYIGSNDKKLHAIDTNTGAAVFTYTTGGAVQSPGLDAEGRVVFGSSDGGLYSVGQGRGIVKGNDATVSAGQPLANFGRDAQLKIGQQTGSEQRTIIGFPIPDLVASVSKNMELVSARLVLTKQVGSPTSSSTVFAHSMTHLWTEAGATWGCANDHDAIATTSQCDATDIWSMTIAALLPYSPTATTSAALGSGSQLTLDVTADVKKAILQGERDDVSWLLRSGGTDLLTFGSAQSSTPPELKLTFQPINRTAARNAKLTQLAAGITNPVHEGMSAWLGWAATCELWRAANGMSSNPTYNALVSDFDAADKQSINAILADVKSVPSGLAATILGPFAGIDPRSCTAAPAFQTMFDIFGANETVFGAHLRAPLCTEANSDVTVGAERIKTPEFLDQDLFLGRSAPTARPVITGIDPSLYLPPQSSVGQYGELGHPALIDDWIQHRGGKNPQNTPNSTENALFPGDGLSPFGVATNVSCTATTYENDTCDHSAGLVCDRLNIFKETVYTAEGKCLAFPVVPREDGIRLRGYNFWDDQPALGLENVFQPAASQILDEPAELQVNANPNEAINCTPGTNLTKAPSLFAAGVGNQNTVKYNINEGSGFYRVRLYNKNGKFRTQADAVQHRAGGRVVHVCRSGIENPPASYEPTGTEGTRLGCTPPSGTCVQDGVSCSAQWAAPGPRTLAECESGITPKPGVPNKCGETPSYFASEGVDAIIYLASKPPAAFTYRAHLDRVECTDETGCDHCGGSDEFEMHMFSSTVAGWGAALQDPVAFREKRHRVYKNQFDHREIKHPERALFVVDPVHRTDELLNYVIFLENDDESVTRTKIVGSIVTSVAAAVVAYFSESEFATASVIALGGGLMQWVISSTESADTIGSRAWKGTYWQTADRVAYTHQPNFLVTEKASPGAMSPLPVDLGGARTFESYLLHPIVGYGRDVKDIAVECSEVSPGYPVCQANTTCYVNQCIGTSERDGAIKWMNGFHDPRTDDPLFNIGYRTRYSLEGASGKYKADYEFMLCPLGSTSPRCTEIP